MPDGPAQPGPTGPKKSADAETDRTAKRRPGRPLQASALRAVIGSRYTAAEAEAIKRAADDRGIARAEFVREAAIAAVGQPDPQRLGAEIRAARRQDLLKVAGVFRELRDYLLEVKYDPGAELAVIHEALGELRAIRAHLLKEAAK